MYSQDMNLVSLGQGFHAPSRIMVPLACEVHQSGKNRTAGSPKTKASQSFQMSGNTHPVTLCQQLKALTAHDLYSAHLVGGYFAPQSLTGSACTAAYCYARCWLYSGYECYVLGNVIGCVQSLVAV